MESPVSTDGLTRSLLLALVALVVCSLGPGWQSPGWLMVVSVFGLAAIARPRGRAWWPWLPVGVALLVASWDPHPDLRPDEQSVRLDRHCRQMLAEAELIATRPTLRGLFEASGEALDPAAPFDLLQERAQRQPGRTVFLADDRGRLVAWGGDQRRFPHNLRPLGERRWGTAWSASGAMLYVREPVAVEGRIVGSLTVADWTPLEARSAWGMAAPFGCRLVLGRNAPDAQRVAPMTSPGVELSAGVRCSGASVASGVVWLPWLLLAGVGLVLAPGWAWLVVLVGGGAVVFAPGDTSETVLAIFVLLASAAVARLCRRLTDPWARLLVIVVLGAFAGVAVIGTQPETSAMLPAHLLQPGWGGVWMVALAWIVAGWQFRGRRSGLSLAARLGIACCVAALALALDVARIPVQVARAERLRDAVVLPRDEVDLGRELPESPQRCRLDDLAPVLARKWRLDRWRTPAELVMIAEDGREISRWGDLTPAEGHIRRIRSWSFPELPGASLDLHVADEPWGWLYDWKSGEVRAAARSSPVWFAVLTRSGAVAASLHPEIRSLDAQSAGELFHSEGGWTRMSVGDRVALSRVWRRGDWLVTAVGRQPEASVWVLRTAVAMVWAFLGLLIASPPALRGDQLSTFGGRLRLLIAGGVVVPLVILTLFLHLRLGQREVEVDQLFGLEAFSAASYTALHLGGVFDVNDELARWLATGLGHEVVLFDQTDVVAVSRPDLMAAGTLPEVPETEVFPTFLVGRDDPVVIREQDRVIAAGGVVLHERRLLLELIRIDVGVMRGAAGAVDWLITGALLASLFALALTSRIESRLSASLRSLVGLAGRLLDGEPVGEIPRPAETDLADVLDAVRSMNEQVQQREISLRHQEELLRITLSTLAPSVMVLEPSGELRFANPSAERLMEVHGSLPLDVVRDLWNKGASQPPAAETLQPLPGQDLTWRVGVTDAPLPDGSRGVVAVVDDVTDVVRADRLRQLNQLARIVAHEVKNPLTPVRLWMQELEEGLRRGDPDLDQLVRDACREISLQVDRLQMTANSFSNLVALESWEPESVDLVEVADDTLAGLTILERRGIRVTRQVAVDGVCRVLGDRQWLQRAIGNLLKNSVDAIGDGGGDIWIRISRGAQSMTLEVEDSAGGIQEDKLQEVFSPHFSTTTAGSGLGLALVHQVVARCQGRVSAANGEHGLVVTVEFPIAEGDEGIRG
jgi:signal transduction histidine kinase